MEKTPIITREGAGSNMNQPGEQRKPFLGLATGTRASRNRNCAQAAETMVELLRGGPLFGSLL